METQARSLLSFGPCERLVDPHLNEDCNKYEMKAMMIAALLCLVHSSSRRPSMKTVVARMIQIEWDMIGMVNEVNKEAKEAGHKGISRKNSLDNWFHGNEQRLGV
ncbi:unnamed protein product [Ilex paraguariensis]|uniref:Uncharacterized protein n=1 Tax=Ilex paraguariensis TaxID=185542 RepID=A0ABC8U1N3_9AQUA